MSERVYGFCKWFEDKRGYGFVYKEDDDSYEYFVHFTSITMDGFKTLKAGQRVSFELKEVSGKGIQAVNVHIED